MADLKINAKTILQIIIESEGVNATGALFVKLEEGKHQDLEFDWDKLKRSTKNRRDKLEQQKYLLENWDRLNAERLG